MHPASPLLAVYPCLLQTLLVAREHAGTAAGRREMQCARQSLLHVGTLTFRRQASADFSAYVTCCVAASDQLYHKRCHLLRQRRWSAPCVHAAMTSNSTTHTRSNCRQSLNVMPTHDGFALPHCTVLTSPLAVYARIGSPTFPGRLLRSQISAWLSSEIVKQCAADCGAHTQPFAAATWEPSSTIGLVGYRMSRIIVAGWFSRVMAQ